MFEKLHWRPDRLIMDELVFRLETSKTDHWELGDECFHFYKDKKLVDQYEQLLAQRGPLEAGNLVELGIWDGGSIAFWYECLQPRKHVAIDRMTRGDSRYFDRYVESRALGQRIKTCWGIDQADSAALRRIMSAEFSGPLDLVIDDASHHYLPSKASFETLFPMLRPGGLYVIEDWQWAYMSFFDNNPYFAQQLTMTQLVIELLEVAGSSSQFFSDQSVISNVQIYPGLVAIERGAAPADSIQPFTLERFTYRRPTPAPRKKIDLQGWTHTWARRLIQRAARIRYR